jgi:DNA ligase-1
MKIFNLFKEIESTPKSSVKKKILSENLNQNIKIIFDDTYNTNRQYYIKKLELSNNNNNKINQFGELTIDDNYNIFHEGLNKLNNREITGNDASIYIADIINKYNNEDQSILLKILKRNLKIGLSYDSFLDIIGERKSKFEVALAENLNKVKNVNPIDGTYFISRKLDGVRCICYVNKYIDNNGNKNFDIKFISRQNKEFTTLSNLIEPIKKLMNNININEWILDGEICMMDDDGNENFSNLMKEITRKNHTIKNPKYNIFDMMLQTEFDGISKSANFSDRLTFMNNLEQQPQVKILEQERVTSQEILDKWINMSKENNWEGCMLRKDVPYKSGRSKDLLKIKDMQDSEYIIKDVITGKMTFNENGNKEFDVVTALVIEHKGNIVNVGSGLSKEQRLLWFNHPEKIIGKQVTIQYFEETQDSKTKEFSLRFPVLKYVYEENRNC